MEIIPAIDIIDGKCVRLSKGDYTTKKVYNEHPLEVAKEFEDAGIKRLHMVDLDGAKSHHIVNHKVLETVASNTALHIDFGGGLKSNDDLRIAFEAGAKQITAGSIAIKSPETVEQWMQEFTAERIILGADTKEGKVAVNGWLEKSELSVEALLNHFTAKGIKYCISTDIAKDGMLQGPSFELYEDLQKQFPNLNVVASGGVSDINDIAKLAEMKLYGVIVGKAIYEGKITLKELKPFIQG